MDTKKKCAHPACNCVPPEGKSYCSTSCEDAKSRTELACQCQHPQCRGEQLKTVLRPVREVSGIAAGISAMVATLVRGRHKSSVDSAPPRTRKCSYRAGPYVDGLTSHKHRQPNPIPSNFRLQIEEFAGLSRAAPDAALLRRGQRMFRKQQKWSP